MHRKTLTTLSGVVAAAVLAASGSAHAAIWQIEKTSGLGNNNAGQMIRIFAEHNTSTGILRWEVDFADTITDGFTLALNDGPNPKGHAGELGLIYFDATGATPEITAFAYNGQNSSNSYKDGNGQVSGNQIPDLILGKSQKDSWVFNGSVVPLGAGQRFILEIQTDPIATHTPLYPSGQDDWTGIGFAEKIGWWFHTYKGLSTSYNGDLLTNWSFSGEGWSDTNNLTTTLVPGPGSLTLAALAGLVAARRRRHR
ncbi:MAG: hypothetical protein ACTS3F_11930 [Phycisphaerales bacterium]